MFGFGRRKMRKDDEFMRVSYFLDESDDFTRDFSKERLMAAMNWATMQSALCVQFCRENPATSELNDYQMKFLLIAQLMGVINQVVSEAFKSPSEEIKEAVLLMAIADKYKESVNFFGLYIEDAQKIIMQIKDLSDQDWVKESIKSGELAWKESQANRDNMMPTADLYDNHDLVKNAKNIESVV